MPDNLVVLVVGDPVDGITITGPFEADEDVPAYAERWHHDETWWIATLYDKEKEPDNV